MVLNGEWKFQLGNPTADFSRPDFDDHSWAAIKVPGNWELQGFENPAYGTKYLKSTEGFYRRKFTVPAAWKGRRTFIRFEGVAFGFEFWIDGKRAGAFASAFNRSEFDITDLVETDRAATLAVRVTRRDEGWEFDTNDDWSLSGIHRDVVLFSLPETHIKDYTVTTSIGADGKDATVRLNASVGKFAGTATEATLSAKLINADGTVAGSISKTNKVGNQADGTFDLEIAVASPKLWTSETPNLYRLDLDVAVAGEIMHQVTQRIGLRSSAIEGGVFKLNGRSVKFRGINHHDLHPETGRAMTREQYVQDLELMKAANINAVRMSHYPPQKLFLDLCDEYGMYVIDEIPFGFGEEHLEGDAYEDVLALRAKSSVARDKNQTSVLVWTVGNENPMTPVVIRTAALVKELDPSRPRCLAHPKGQYFTQPPAELDIIAPHYLAARAAPLKMSKGSPFLEEILDRPEVTAPVLMTEYAHAAGTSLEDLAACWEVMQKHDRFIGGCIWHFQDQGIYRTVPSGSYPGLPRMTDTAPVEIGKVSASTWVSDERVIDTNGPAGADGIVDADRFPQSDYFAVRKVYAPIFIAVDSLPVKAGRQSLSIPIENRYDFTDLARVSGTWALMVDGKRAEGSTLSLQAAPRCSTTAQIPVNLPQDVTSHDLFLHFAFVDASARQIVERTVRLLPDGKPSDSFRQQLDKLAGHPITRTEKGPLVTYLAGDSRLEVNRDTGSVTFGGRDSKLAFDGLALRVGRAAQTSEVRAYAHSAEKPGFWDPYLLTNPTVKAVDAYPIANDNAKVRLTLRFNRADPSDNDRAELTEQAFTADVRLTLTSQGQLDVEYQLSPDKASDYLLELGLALKLPSSSHRLTWLGNGPYPTYPAQPQSMERGVYSVAPRPAFDPANRMYPGNRTAVSLAAATDDVGNGLGVACETDTVSLEPHNDAAYFSHLVRVAGHGMKRERSLQTIKASELKPIRGNLRVVPLVAGQWPEVFQSVLGNEVIDRTARDVSKHTRSSTEAKARQRAEID
jgi:beta-galactosidase